MVVVVKAATASLSLPPALLHHLPRAHTAATLQSVLDQLQGGHHGPRKQVRLKQPPRDLLVDLCDLIWCALGGYIDYDCGLF